MSVEQYLHIYQSTVKNAFLTLFIVISNWVSILEYAQIGCVNETELGSL